MATDEPLNSFVSPKSSVSAPPEPQTTHKRRGGVVGVDHRRGAAVGDGFDVAASASGAGGAGGGGGDNRTVAIVEEPAQPPGAAVSIDGKASGPSPVEVALAPGEHEVVATFATGPVAATVTVRTGETAAVVLHQRRPLRVQGPTGARVSLAGAPIGVVPLESADVLSVGQVAELRVEADGFEPFVTTWHIEPATNTEPVAVFAAAPETEDVRRNERSARRDDELPPPSDREPEVKRERREKQERPAEGTAFGLFARATRRRGDDGRALRWRSLRRCRFGFPRQSRQAHARVAKPRRQNQRVDIRGDPRGWRAHRASVEFEKKGERYAVKKVTKR